MECMWGAGEASVSRVSELLGNSLAYTTVMTTLDRLYKKGWLLRRREGRSYIYAPVMSRPEFEARQARSLFQQALAGDWDRRPVLSCFIDAVTESDRAALDALEQLIREKRKQLRKS